MPDDILAGRNLNPPVKSQDWFKFVPLPDGRWAWRPKPGVKLKIVSRLVDELDHLDVVVAAWRDGELRLYRLHLAPDGVGRVVRAEGGP